MERASFLYLKSVTNAAAMMGCFSPWAILHFFLKFGKFSEKFRWLRVAERVVFGGGCAQNPLRGAPRCTHAISTRCWVSPILFYFYCYLCSGIVWVCLVLLGKSEFFLILKCVCFVRGWISNGRFEWFVFIFGIQRFWFFRGWKFIYFSSRYINQLILLVLLVVKFNCFSLITHFYY